MFALVLVFVVMLRDLLSYLALTLSLTAACSAACLFLPSIRRHPLLHPASLVPLFYVAATVLAGTLMAIGDSSQVVGTVLTFATGVVIYAIRGRHRGNAP